VSQWTARLPLLGPGTDVGVRDGSAISKSLSLSVTETSAGSGRLAGGISNSTSDAFRLLLAADRSTSLSGSDTTFSLIVGAVVGRIYQ
jgi:hypothetical protein